MIEDLGSASRALLDAAREGLTPDVAAVARVRAKVGASVGAGTVAGTLAGKLGVLAVVAAVAIGAALYSRRDRDVASERIASFEPQPAARATPVLQTAHEQAPEAPETAMPPMIVSRVAPPPPRLPRRTDLGREVELIDQAMAAMRRGDPAAALAAIHTHAAETAGSGQLAEDAAAIEIEAACRLHDPVDAKLAAFDARWPESAQRSRLTHSCH